MTQSSQHCNPLSYNKTIILQFDRAQKHLLEGEAHLLLEEALYKLAHNQDTGMDTEQSHSIVGSIDNTVDKPAFAVE